MPDSRIPLYLITGFLDAGKTTLLSDTLNMDYFNDGQRTSSSCARTARRRMTRNFCPNATAGLCPSRIRSS